MSEVLPEAVAVLDSSIRIVHIPPGHQQLGLEFTESPPRITKVDPKSPLEGNAEVGLYVHALILPELEIVNINDSDHLTALLAANVALTRQLWLSPSQSYVDVSLGSTHKGALYKHHLPASPNLGFVLVSWGSEMK
jgi:hypothetical protein